MIKVCVPALSETERKEKEKYAHHANEYIHRYMEGGYKQSFLGPLIFYMRFQWYQILGTSKRQRCLKKAFMRIIMLISFQSGIPEV